MIVKKAIFIGLTFILMASFMLTVGCANEKAAETTPAIESLNIDSSLWDTELSYSVKYPTEWIVEGTSSDDNILFMKGDDAKDNHMPSNLGITSVGQLDTNTLDKAVQEMQFGLSSIYDNYIDIDTSRKQIKGNNAVIWTWTGDISPEALLSPEEIHLAVVTGIQLLKGKYALLSYNNVVYLVVYTAVQEVYDERYFDWFLDNLEFHPYSSELSPTITSSWTSDSSQGPIITEFPTVIEKVYVNYNYESQIGSIHKIIWYDNEGKVLSSSEHKATRASGTGTWSWDYSQLTTSLAGSYKAELFIDDILLTTVTWKVLE